MPGSGLAPKPQSQPARKSNSVEDARAAAERGLQAADRVVGGDAERSARALASASSSVERAVDQHRVPGAAVAEDALDLGREPAAACGCPDARRTPPRSRRWLPAASTVSGDDGVGFGVMAAERQQLVGDGTVAAGGEQRRPRD